MNRQAINLLGALVVALIVVLGVILGVLPRWQQARAADADRQTVALQNQSQQQVIAALAQERQQLPQLQTQVDELEQEIPAGPRLDQLIDLTTGLPDGAVLRTITPDDTASTSTATAPVPATSGFATFPVSLTIDLRQATDAAKVLDKLRAGPRLLAVDETTLGAGTGGSAAYTLTVTGRVFLNPGATS